MSYATGYSGSIASGATVSVTSNFRPHGDMADGERASEFFPLMAAPIPIQIEGTWDGNTISLQVKYSGCSEWVEIDSFTADEVATTTKLPIGCAVRLVEDGAGSPENLKYSIGHHLAL